MLQPSALPLALLSCTTALGLCVASFSGELTTNGDFETGDTSSWDSFPTPNSTFVVTTDANSGSFAGQITNTDQAAAAVIKQSNLGVGLVNPGDPITISFSAKGSGMIGGVSFAELFSEVAGGGVSASEILSGAPLMLTSSYQPFIFNTVAGPDVSGGVTLQFAVVTGANIGSTSELFLDDVSLTVGTGGAQNYCDVTPNSVGSGAVMGFSGTTSVGAEDFVIEASGLPPNAFYLFFVGMGTANTPSFNGTLCISSPCRLGSPLLSTAAGTASRALPTAEYLSNGCAPPMAGSQFTFQCVYRDTVGTNANWTDGLCVLFAQ